MPRRHRLSDAEWTSIHIVLNEIPGIWKRDLLALRRFTEAVLYVLRTGVAWADLPEEFGNPDVVRRRHRRWAEKGV